MDTKNLKHIAVIEAESKAELLKKVNEAVDEHGLEIIHFSMEEQIDLYDNTI